MTDIDSKTSLFCVIGDPVSHSMSPVIHNYAFEKTGFNGVYTAFRVEDIKNAAAGIRALGIKGVSVTIPHKLAVMEFLDEIDDSSEKIGAVNTILNDNGILKGFNTDCDGAVKALFEKTQIKGRKVLVFGAGGSARAIGYGIIKNDGDLTITNRTIDKGSKLAGDLSCSFENMEEVKPSDFDILINTTSLGMTPNTQSSPVNKSDLRQDQVVMDIVYNPIKTKLLTDAEEIGCKTVNGVSMFVNQAVLQFEMWTGKKAPIDGMKKLVIEKLKNG